MWRIDVFVVLWCHVVLVLRIAQTLDEADTKREAINRRKEARK
jgi:hypothetical protein